MNRNGFDQVRRRSLGAGMAAAILPAWAQTPAAGSSRVALVIGNSNYPSAPLRNATKDGVAMAQALAELGFGIVQAQNASRTQMDDAIRAVREQLSGRSGVGMLFYAGHAVQLDWRNFLLPVDAAPSSAAEVPRHGVDVQTVIDAFRSAGNRMNIVVLDACRDNPFGEGSGRGRGLAPMDAPPGTYLAYATAPGHTADDGDEAAGNGLYTRFLLREIVQPRARLEDVFKRVRLQVRRASNGRQVPWDSTSLEDDFYFASGQQAPEATQNERTAAFEAEKAEWDRIRDSARPEDFYNFLQRFPNGSMNELAQFHLNRLVRPLLQPVYAPEKQVRMPPPGSDRYRVGDSVTHSETDRLAGTATTITRRVTAIEGRIVKINDGQLVFDQMGNVLRSRTATFDPGSLLTPDDLHVGKRWRSSTWGREQENEARFLQHVNYQVAGLEELTIPAGRFKAFRIVGEGERIWPSKTIRFRHERWVDAETLHFELVEKVYGEDGPGLPTIDRVFTMLARKLASAARP